MDSIETVCEVCHGTRYSEEVLKYQYKGKNIAEVMDMTVRQAIKFFENVNFVSKLDTLAQVGLGYLHLNQSMSTLSGGELQRFCIARALGKRTRFLLADEITTMLDLVTQSEIWHFLMDEIRRRGIGLLAVSHDRELLDRICTRQIDLQAEQGAGR